MTDSHGFIDTETRSRTPIRAGTDLYTRDAQCLIVTWAVDESPVRLWDTLDEPAMPRPLEDLLIRSDIPLIAHSASFDANIFRHALRLQIDPTRWRCTRAQAYAHGLPGALELLGLVLGLSEDHQKLKMGKDLIKFFCEPRGDDEFNSPFEFPEKWAEFKRYAMQDTDTLREVYRKMMQRNYTGENVRQWHLDQRINARGFGFDRSLARDTLDFLAVAKDVIDRRMANATGNEVTAPTQRNRLLNYLQQKCGLNIANLRASEVRSWLEADDLDPDVRTLLEMRLEAGKSSSSKYRRGLEILGPGDRVRYALQFSGAGRTGRYSGKGFQPHNMTRPVLLVRTEEGKLQLTPVKATYIDDVIIPGIRSRAALNMDMIYGGPYEAAALALRHVIVAAPGNELVDGDWSNIESRIIAWIANETWKLEAYRARDRGEGADIYKLLFSQFFGTQVENVNDTERQGGKVCDLAFSFGGGVPALVAMAAGYQMDLDPLAEIVLPRATPEQLKKAYRAWRRAFICGEDYDLDPKVYQACDVLKQTYRASNKAINTLRHEIDSATKNAIRNPGSATVVGRCTIWSTGTWLIIELPNKDRLLYANPRIQREKSLDDDLDDVWHEYITYETARHQTWRRDRAWSGLFVENIVQAIAARILRTALLKIDEESRKIPAVAAYLNTLPVEERTAICLHVHDAVTLDVPKGSVSLKQLTSWMTERTEAMAWAEGLPLSASGWINYRYGSKRE